MQNMNDIIDTFPFSVMSCLSGLLHLSNFASTSNMEALSNITDNQQHLRMTFGCSEQLNFQNSLVD